MTTRMRIRSAKLVNTCDDFELRGSARAGSVCFELRVLMRVLMRALMRVLMFMSGSRRVSSCCGNSGHRTPRPRKVEV